MTKIAIIMTGFEIHMTGIVTTVTRLLQKMAGFDTHMNDLS